jgi:hypothetical protein
MPVQTPPAAPETEPATGTAEALGEGGKQALQQERDARKTAERELKKLTDRLAALELAGKSEQEQAVAKAKAEGASEAMVKADAKVRRAEVKAALAAAGCTKSDLLANAPAFASLAVDEDGNVAGLNEEVSKAKTAYSELFGGKRPGSWDAGSPTALGSAPTFRASQLNDRAFYVANQAAIMQALRDGRVVDDNPK